MPKNRRKDYDDLHHFPLTKVDFFSFAKYLCNRGVFGFCVLMCTVIVTIKMKSKNYLYHSSFGLYERKAIKIQF